MNGHDMNPQATADHVAAHAELLASFAQWQQRRII